MKCKFWRNIDTNSGTLYNIRNIIPQNVGENVREREKMQDKTKNNSLDDILEGFKSSGGKASEQEALDKVNEMFAAARAAGKPDKKKKKVSSSESEAVEKPAPFSAKPQKNESYQEAVNKVTEMLSAPKNEISDSDTGEQTNSSQDAVDRVAEMFDMAIAANGKVKKNSSKASSAGLEVIVLEVISILFFIFSLNSNLPEIVSLIAVFMPAIVGILSKMLLQQLTLKDAVSKSKLHIAVTLLFLVVVIMSLV